MTKKKERIVEFSKLERKVAALWTRVSTEKQEQNNCSLETQEAICREYAKNHNITIKKTFGGTHESAKTEGKMYKDMIAAVANDKEINIILVYSFDRFSRAGTEAMMTKAYLKSKGVYVVSATQATDPDSPAGTFMENIIFLFNQFENDLRRDKSVAGMISCIRKGDWYSKAPLGYNRKKEGKSHILTINEDGLKLRKAFEWKANEECSDIEIVRRLKSIGLNVDRKHLSKIFHNKFYCGYIEHSLLGDEIVRGNQQVLIDEATFNKINGISKAGYEHEEITEDFPLKRHIKCADCSGYLTGYTTKGQKYYKCNKKGCKSNHRADKLHDKYVELLNGYQIPEEIKPILREVLIKTFYEFNKSQDDIKSQTLKRRTELEQQQMQVQVRFGLGQITKDVYDNTLSYILTQKNDLEQTLSECENDYSNLMKYTDEAIAFISQLGTSWKMAHFNERQSLQNLIFPEGIYYDKGTDSYRTIVENEALLIFKRISTIYNADKEKAATESTLLSPLVGMRRLERPTPTSRT